jgi:hypothetical protein
LPAGDRAATRDINSEPPNRQGKPAPRAPLTAQRVPSRIAEE